MSYKLLIVSVLASVNFLQAQPYFHCVANLRYSPLARGGGVAELAGDIVLACSGGTGTPAGHPVPLANISLTFSTNVTSALLADPLSEALLLIDDPVPSIQRACTAFLAPGDTIPKCAITGTGTGGGVYTGAPDRPNIFQGARGDSPNQLVFLGVPLDPPGWDGVRVLRITNIRVNPKHVGVGEGPQRLLSAIRSFVSIDGVNGAHVPIDGADLIVAFPEKASDFSVYSSSTAGFNYELEFRERFSTAFKKQSAGAQSQPGLIFNTESGFYNPALPLTNGLSHAGLATQGTRLMVRFQGVPAGAQIRVSTAPPGSSTISARLTNTDASGAGPYSPTPETGPGVAMVPIFGGRGQVVYEILDSDPFYIESFGIGVWVSNGILPAVSGSFAPVSAEDVAAANAPTPRFHNVPLNPDKAAVFLDGMWYLDVSGNGAWEPGLDRGFRFGGPGMTQVIGDWNGDGMKEVGVFQDGHWYLDLNGNGKWDGSPTDGSFSFGWGGATPIVGDWNGDGKAEIGVFSEGHWYLDYNGNGSWNGPGADRGFDFGWAGVTPLVGDWDGDRKAEVGVYYAGFWYLDYNGNGAWDGFLTDKWMAWGWPGATPVIGDWSGDGKTKIGIFADGDWYLDNNGNGLWDGSVYGGGPWDSYDIDKAFHFGWAGATPVVGDWNGDGGVDVGVFNDGFWYLDYDGDGVWTGFTSDRGFGFGWSGTKPVAANW